MDNYPVLYLMTGLLFGTTLLALGVALGFWMGRKSPASSDAASQEFAMDPARFLTMVKAVASWTNDVAGDVSHYQTQIHRFSAEAEKQALGEENADVRNMLGRIIAANEHLKKRLEATEEKLESQTSQLEGYLAEARTDALTGLSNRRAFDKQMDELYAKHNRSPFPFTLAMVDIDHFKSINDTHGHAVGDAVLRHLAGILRGFSPHCVMAARYGGEEFAMIFEEPLETSAEVMEKVRAMVASKPALVDQLSVPLTLSSGVAELVSGERLGDLFRHADEALYSAKKGGRNQVVRYTSVPTDLRSRPPLMRSETAAASATPKPAGTSTGRGAPKMAASGATSSPSLRTANPAPSSSSATATQAIDELELRVLEHLDGLVQAEARGSASK